MLVVDPTTFKCVDCGITGVSQDTGGTGYGLEDRNGARVKVCYQCCAKSDVKRMRVDDKATLYVLALTDRPQGECNVTNWPGSLKFRGTFSRSSHNWRNVQRTDAWFRDSDGLPWHGVNLGDNDLLRCKRVKDSARFPVAKPITPIGWDVID